MEDFFGYWGLVVRRAWSDTRSALPTELSWGKNATLFVKAAIGFSIVWLIAGVSVFAGWDKAAIGVASAAAYAVLVYLYFLFAAPHRIYSEQLGQLKELRTHALDKAQRHAVVDELKPLFEFADQMLADKGRFNGIAIRTDAENWNNKVLKVLRAGGVAYGKIAEYETSQQIPSKNLDDGNWSVRTALTARLQKLRQIVSELAAD